jgi:hypothetical protein
MSKFFKFSLIYFFTFFLLDVSIGKYLYKKFVKIHPEDINTNVWEPDKYFDHKFIKNYDNLAGWGNKRFKLCTDDNRFKISCSEKITNNKNFDLGFIGDSFTEGVGLVYEDTYVGQIASSLKNKSVANLAVSSYSPSIYFTKIKNLLDNKYTFKEIIVFVDISDLIDDTLCYKVENNKTIRRQKFNICYDNFNENKSIVNKFYKKNFNFTQLFVKKINVSLINLNLKKDKISKEIINNSRSEWTYNYRKEHFNNQSLEETIKISTDLMYQLSDLLKKNSIKLSVAVFPHPSTLYHDVRNNLQVKIWKRFCQTECKSFYNFMDIFFNEFEENFYNSYKKNFIDGDLHFNFNGSKLIADKFIKDYQ